MEAKTDASDYYPSDQIGFVVYPLRDNKRPIGFSPWPKPKKKKKRKGK